MKHSTKIVCTALMLASFIGTTLTTDPAYARKHDDDDEDNGGSIVSVLNSAFAPIPSVPVNTGNNGSGCYGASCFPAPTPGNGGGNGGGTQAPTPTPTQPGSPSTPPSPPPTSGGGGTPSSCPVFMGTTYCPPNPPGTVNNSVIIGTNTALIMEGIIFSSMFITTNTPFQVPNNVMMIPINRAFDDSGDEVAEIWAQLGLILQMASDENCGFRFKIKLPGDTTVQASGTVSRLKMILAIRKITPNFSAFSNCANIADFVNTSGVLTKALLKKA